MSKLMISMIAAAGIGFAGAASAQTYTPGNANVPMSTDGSTSATPGADAQQKIDLDKCASMTGTPKDKCVAQANARAKISLAKEESAAAIAKCDGMSGAAKASCVKEAQPQ
jgi:hypothetical protein